VSSKHPTSAADTAPEQQLQPLMMMMLMPQHMQLVTKPRLHYAMLANTRALVIAIPRPYFDQFSATKRVLSSNATRDSVNRLQNQNAVAPTKV